MPLSSLFASSEPAEKYLLTIVLTESYIQSAFWKFDQQQVVIMDRSDRHTYTDDQDCLKQIDQSLQELSRESESANEVVFGLEPNWVTPTGVSDLKKPLLKKVTQELSLKAVGFVVIGEAVYQSVLKSQAYLTALLLEIQQDELRVSLIKQGKLMATEKVGRSGDTAADLAEGLARFGKAAPALAQLPSKIILFSYQLTEDELANEEQAILHHDWVSSQTFLQPPFIEILTSGTVLDAVVVEGGTAVGQSLGLLPAVSSVASDPTNAFGFHQVDEATTANPADTAAFTEPGSDTSTAAPVATSFGVPISDNLVNPDTHQTMRSEQHPVSESLMSDRADEVPPDDDEIVEPAHKSGRGFAGLSSLNPRFLSHKPIMIGGFVVGLIVLLAGIYLFLRLTSTATLAIKLKTQPVSREVALTLDPAATSPSETTLPVTRVNREVQGTLSLPTTGVKLVGDAAKGKVTLFNKTTSAKTFESGTVLSSGELRFTLDEEVVVASASVTTSGNSETKTFGEATVNVTAANIGTDSNLGKDTQFKVATFDESTYAATNSEAFGGGSSREVRVAAEADQAKLLSELRTQLLTDAETEFANTADVGTELVPSGQIAITQSEYSAKVGDEVDTLSLTATAEVEAYSYQNDQLKPLVEELLKGQVPAGFDLISDKIQILSETQAEIASNSSQVTLAANLSSEVKPQVDQAALKSEVEGKSISHALSILGSKSEIAQFSFEFTPKIAQQLVRIIPSGDRLVVHFE